MPWKWPTVKVKCCAVFVVDGWFRQPHLINPPWSHTQAQESAQTCFHWSSALYVTKIQSREVTEYKYFVTLIKYSFQVSVLYLSWLVTFQTTIYFNSLLLNTNICTFYYIYLPSLCALPTTIKTIFALKTDEHIEVYIFVIFSILLILFEVRMV